MIFLVSFIEFIVIAAHHKSLEKKLGKSTSNHGGTAELYKAIAYSLDHNRDENK